MRQDSSTNRQHGGVHFYKIVIKNKLFSGIIRNCSIQYWLGMSVLDDAKSDKFFKSKSNEMNNFQI